MCHRSVFPTGNAVGLQDFGVQFKIVANTKSIRSLITRAQDRAVRRVSTSI